jgi:hypothetical protein
MMTVWIPREMLVYGVRDAWVYHTLAKFFLFVLLSESYWI